MTEETATFAQFARILGVKPSAVTALRQAGRLVLTDDGKAVRVDASHQRLRDTADPSKAAVAARHAATRGAGWHVGADGVSGPQAPAESETENDDQDAEASSIGGYQTSRARREHFLALAAERDYALSIGKLMDADEVCAAVGSATATLRAGLERLPDVLAPQLAAITDEGEARGVLAEAIQHTLDEMARKFSNIAKQGVGNG